MVDAIERHRLAGCAAFGCVGVLALFAAGGSGRSDASPTATAATCGQVGWPRLIQGRPAGAAPAARPGYALWHRHDGWHLALAATRSAPVKARVVTDGRIRLLGSQPGVRRSARAFSLTVTSTRVVRLSFLATCARRVSVKFATGAPSAVRLGRHAAAPTPAFALERPAVTGVSGQVLRGPTCPVVGARECLPASAKPAPGDISIDTAPTSKSAAGGQHVTTIATDSSARFRVRLAPGRYVFTPEQGARSRPETVDVVPGVESRTILVVDTGIR